MRRALKKMFVLGMGAAALTKDKADKSVRELVKQGKLSRKEGDKLVKSLMQVSAKHGDFVETRVKKETQRVVAKLGPATRKELTRLSKKIEALEKRHKPAPKRKVKKKKPVKRKAVKRKKPVKKPVKRKRPSKRR